MGLVAGTSSFVEGIVMTGRLIFGVVIGGSTGDLCGRGVGLITVGDDSGTKSAVLLDSAWGVAGAVLTNPGDVADVGSAKSASLPRPFKTD